MGPKTFRYRVVRLNGLTTPVMDEEKEILSEIGACIVPIEGETPDSIVDAARDADALMVIASKITSDIIRSLTKCKIIARLGTGIDNIDVKTATQHGIVVTNLPSFGTTEMAEHTMALLLALARKLPTMDKATRLGRWSIRPQHGIRRVEGRLLGLVGFGRTARAVATRAKAFGIRVKGYHYRHAPGEIVDGVEMTSLEYILQHSHFVSLHVPLTEKTYHMIGENELKMMRPDAFLINTSRGTVVEENALTRALQEGWIAGAGIDVYESVNVFFSPDGPPAHPLFQLDNVIFTPHIAASSMEAGINGHAMAAGQVRDVLSGKWPVHVVNPDVIPRIKLVDR